jgi:hypothetical protein
VLDQLSPLVEGAFGSGGSLTSGGKIVGKDDTFAKSEYKNDTVFIATGSAKQEAIPWKRSKNIQNDSYTGVSPGNPDALKFRARRDLYWCGILWPKEWDKKDFKFKMEWRIDGGSTEGPVEVS